MHILSIYIAFGNGEDIGLLQATTARIWLSTW